jgi:hypothetical protein
VVWPALASTVAGAAVLTTAVSTSLGWAAGGITVGALWMVLVALFLARLPGRTAPGRRASDPLSFLAVTLLAGVGFAVGTVLAPADPSLPGSVIATATGALAATGLVGFAWRFTMTGWLRTLRLAELRAALVRADSLADDRIRDHVRGFEHRGRLSDAALLLASGVTGLAQLYAERAARDREPDSAAHGQVAAELLNVLRGDLVSLTMRALDNYLHAIGTDAKLATDTAALAIAASGELTEYHAFLDTHGIHVNPPMVAENPARETLSLAMWQRSETGRRVLRSDGRDELVQLCQAGDVRALNVTWSEVLVLRFAPADVTRIVLGNVPADVLSADTDMVGVLRLVPLASGRVLHVYPTDPDPDYPERPIS